MSKNKVIKSKIKVIEKDLKKLKTEKETLDLNDEVLHYLNKMAKKYNTTVEVIVNYILSEYIINQEKIKYKDKFDNVVDSIELNFNKIKSTTLVINYSDIKQKYCLFPYIETTTGINNTITEYIQNNDINKSDEYLNEYFFIEYHLDIKIDKNKFIVNYIPDLERTDEKQVLIFDINNIPIKECYKKVLEYVS